jgi:5-methylthioadenosine/S-adenosylhomocysteine deaminase
VTQPSNQKLDGEHCYYGAAVGLAEALHSGTTSVLNFFGPARDESLWRGIARGFSATGVRGFLGFGLTDNLERAPGGRSLDEQLTAIGSFTASGLAPLLRPMLAPGVVWRMSPDGFRRIRAEAEDSGWPMTLHLHEIQHDEAVCLEQYGKPALRILEEEGWLGTDVVPAHCCFLSDADIEIAAKTGANVSTNPISNMYLGNKLARVPEMIRAGINVCLGADGAASNNTQDLFEAMKMCVLVQTGHCEDAAKLTAQEALHIATINGARAVGMEDEIGSIEVGKLADFFLFDPRSVRRALARPGFNRRLRWRRVQRHNTVVGGVARLRYGKLAGLDEPSLMTEAQASAERLRDAPGTSRLLSRRRSTSGAISI